MRSIVVLPEPDGPSIEKNSPDSTSRSTPSTATMAPKRFVTPRISTATDDALAVLSFARASTTCSRTNPPDEGIVLRRHDTHDTTRHTRHGTATPQNSVIP